MKVKIISTNRRCDSNIFDFLKIKSLLDKAKVKTIKNEKEADFVVIVTCASISLTREFTVKKIHELGKRNKDKKIIVYGCFPKIMENKIDDLKKIYKNIIFIKTFDDFKKLFNLSSILDIENTSFDEKIYSYLVDDPEFYYKVIEKIIKIIRPLIKEQRKINILDAITHKNKINILIGNGCNGKCSYCYIKISRGNIKSREEKDIINDINLYSKMFDTINLTGDDCSSWGLDKNKKFYELLEKLIIKFPNKKFEIRYLNPSIILRDEKKYLEIFSNKNFKVLNIAIQSGSNKVLKLMNRNYEIEKVISFVKQLKKLNSEIIIRTHIIVQHPKEEISDFIKTLKAVKNFDLTNVFIYTPPPNEKMSFKNRILGKIKTTIVNLYNLFNFFRC